MTANPKHYPSLTINDEGGVGGKEELGFEACGQEQKLDTKMAAYQAATGRGC